MGIHVKARNGNSLSLSYIYWSWIRHVAAQEGVKLPPSGSTTASLSNDEAKELAVALRVRAEKVRKGFAPRDANSYVRRIDKQWFPSHPEQGDIGTLSADFDDPDSMEKTANFFYSSGGVALKY